LKSYLEGKVAAPVYKVEITAVRICHALCANFADKWRSLGRQGSLADSDDGVLF
jgi:hypothetical protein